MERLQRSLVVLLFLSSIVLAVPVFAQAELYAVTHPFALATATTTRLFGMGGFATCIPDAGFANPAFAGTLTNRSVVARESITTFDSGLKIRGEQFSAAVPLKADKKGLQFSAFRLSTADPLPLAGPLPATLRMSENDLSVHYGQRVSKRLVFGAAVSPVFHNSVSTDAVGGGALGRLKASASDGFRLGGLYQLGDKGWVGAVYDRYREDVTASGPMVGGGPFTLRFTSEEMVAGASYRLAEGVIGALEWQQLTGKQGGIRRGDAGWRAGIEARLDNNISFRVGDNDGSLSLGVGLNDRRWNFNYAFVKNWNKDLVGDVLGEHSDTHQLEATYTW